MDAAFTFIGGLGDGPGVFHSRIVASVAERASCEPEVLGLPGICLVDQPLYLEWTDAAFGRRRARQRLAAWTAQHPGAPHVVVGHSYGAEAAVRTVSRSTHAIAHLVTIDGVSWRTKLLGDRKPINVEKWTNVFVSGIRDHSDVVALVGGQWKWRRAADHNIDAAQHRVGVTTHRSFYEMWLLAAPFVRDTIMRHRSAGCQPR